MMSGSYRPEGSQPRLHNILDVHVDIHANAGGINPAQVDAKLCHVYINISSLRSQETLDFTEPLRVKQSSPA